MLALACTLGLSSGCSEEPPPRSVAEFVDDPIGLEAALTRCNADRGRTRSDPECINAREATRRVSIAEEAERRREFERQSQRKLDELRSRTEALEARLREAEQQRLAREKLEYEQQFQQQIDGNIGPEVDSSADGGEPAPVAGDSMQSDEGATVVDTPTGTGEVTAETAGTDLESLREELKRRNDDSGG